MSNKNEIINENLQSSCSEKKKNILFLVLKKHKIALLFLTFLLLISTTMCWFIYNKVVSTDFQAHIKSWEFEVGNNSGNVEIKFDDLYPGMEDNQTLKITNKGELNGKITVEVQSITLFGRELERVTDDREPVYGEEYKVVLDEVNPNSFEIKGFPFDTLHFELERDTLTTSAGNNETKIDAKLIWNYDNEECNVDGQEFNTCDELDTLFGNMAYDFYKIPYNDGKPSLSIKLRISIVQDNTDN